MKNALQYYIDEQLLSVFFFPNDNKGTVKGFIIFANDSVKPHVKMSKDGLTLKVLGQVYSIDAEFYATYGIECKDIEDAYNRAKAFRSIDLLWPPTSKKK